MKSLYFEHENKKKKTNLVIIIIALITLTCIGFGYSYTMKQSGNDNIKHTMGNSNSTIGNVISQSETFL